MKPMQQHEIPGLPKWPAVYVTGKSVSVHQARDIITRTDSNLHHVSKFGFSNDHEFDGWFLRVSGLSKFIEIEEKVMGLYHDPRLKNDPAALQAEKEKIMGPFGAVGVWDIQRLWRNEMKIIATQYVHNTHLASCYIGGPTGWCHPNGNIYVEGHNYGKWPSVEDVVHDWETLVKEFPYLDLKCTLFDEEAHSDATPRPLVTIVVKDGAVTVCHPDLSAHDAPPDDGKPFVLDETTIGSIFSRQELDWPSGWPREWAEDFCVRSAAVVAAIFKDPKKYAEKHAEKCNSEEEQE